MWGAMEMMVVMPPLQMAMAARPSVMVSSPLPAERAVAERY